jgi:hypothetical protein
MIREVICFSKHFVRSRFTNAIHTINVREAASSMRYILFKYEKCRMYGRRTAAQYLIIVTYIEVQLFYPRMTVVYKQYSQYKQYLNIYSTTVYI